jgi:chromosome partitioning protein
MAATVLTVTSQKGGSGKTTTVMTIAAELADRGFRVLVGDADEQQTAYRWANCTGKPFPATVISLSAFGDNIYEEVSKHRDDFDFIILDTAPSTASPVIHSALLLSDAVIVPIQPAPADIWSALATTTLIAGIQKVRPELRARILANRVNRTSLSRMVLGTLGNFGIPVMQSRLHARVAYQEATLAGGSLARLGAAAKVAKEEVSTATDELLAFLGGGK